MKANKKQKNLYLSDQARQLLAAFSRNMGISETAVVELLLREKAGREGASLPSLEASGRTSLLLSPDTSTKEI